MLSKGNIPHSKTVLTQYSSCELGKGPTLKPPGKYICPECGDATITFHTTVDEYKVKCPKCNAPMVIIKTPLSIG